MNSILKNPTLYTVKIKYCFIKLHTHTHIHVNIHMWVYWAALQNILLAAVPIKNVSKPLYHSERSMGTERPNTTLHTVWRKSSKSRVCLPKVLNTQIGRNGQRTDVWWGGGAQTPSWERTGSQSPRRDLQMAGMTSDLHGPTAPWKTQTCQHEHTSKVHFPST